MRMGVLSSVIAVQLVISARQRPPDEPCPKGSRWPRDDHNRCEADLHYSYSCKSMSFRKSQRT